MADNNGLFGRYFSMKLTSVTAGQDLITTLKTNSGQREVDIEKLTFIADADVAIDINELGAWSYLYENEDGTFRLSLDANDVKVTSFKIKDTATVNIFIAMVF